MNLCQNNRQLGFDFIKIISCLFVVLIHIKTPLIDFYFPYIRCAVPVFFCSAGYFAYKYDRLAMIDSLRKRIKYFATLFVLISGFYILLNGLTFQFSDIIKLLLFNEPWYGEHLWFLPAYLYVLIITYMFLKFTSFNISLKILYILVPLMLIQLSLGTYSNAIFGSEFPNYYTRNFLYEGIPYFFAGVLFRLYYDRLKCKHTILLWLLLLIGIIVTFLEVSILSNRGLMTSRYSFIGTIIMTVSLIIIAMNIKIDSGGRYGRIVERLASKYILPIYLFHPFFVVLLNKSFLSFTIAYEYLIPFYSIFLTVIVTYLFEYILKR